MAMPDVALRKDTCRPASPRLPILAGLAAVIVIAILLPFGLGTYPLFQATQVLVFAMALLGIGYRSLSMSPSSIGPVKAMILGLDLGRAEKFLASLMEGGDGRPSLREDLRSFATEHGVPL